MTTPQDLLEHGRGLLFKPKPTQADLKRAVSVFYYSVFHLLSQSGTTPFVNGGAVLQAQVARAFNHTAMRKVCEAYSRRKPFPAPLDALVVAPPSAELLLVCDSFIELQQARHSADYDLVAHVPLIDCVDHWAGCTSAHLAFGKIESTPEASVFLAALLLNDRWTRRG